MATAVASSNGHAARAPSAGDPPALAARPSAAVSHMELAMSYAASGRARYTKGELLGRGACKTVYKAFDESEGVERAWNEITVSGEFSALDERERERIFAEIKLLKQLKHKNVLALYDYWFDKKTSSLVFITELFYDGSLRSYRRRHKNVDTGVIKRWAWQILQGLVYLHGHNPPIIHRDLKSDNIFVNGASGTLKIGDLGFATFRAGFSGAMSVIGTPEFMAPELYEERYDEKVDIYSFGMCLLELATLEYPYSECRNAAQIFKKVTQGVPPQGLSKITDEELRKFVLLCIQPDPAKRPEARQLLKHPFFEAVRLDGAAAARRQQMAQAAAPAGVGPAAAAAVAGMASLTATAPPVLPLPQAPHSPHAQLSHGPPTTSASTLSLVTTGGGGGAAGSDAARGGGGGTRAPASPPPPDLRRTPSSPSSLLPSFESVTLAMLPEAYQATHPLSVRPSAAGQARSALASPAEGDALGQRATWGPGAGGAASSNTSSEGGGGSSGGRSDHGTQLAQALIEQYQKQHGGAMPPAGELLSIAAAAARAAGLRPPSSAGVELRLSDAPLGTHSSGGRGDDAAQHLLLFGGVGSQGSASSTDGRPSPSGAAGPRGPFHSIAAAMAAAAPTPRSTGSGTGGTQPPAGGLWSRGSGGGGGTGLAGRSRECSLVEEEGDLSEDEGETEGADGDEAAVVDAEPSYRSDAGTSDSTGGSWARGDSSEGGGAGPNGRGTVLRNTALGPRVRLACRNHHDNTLAFSMSFVNHSGTRKKVGFEYDLDADTASEVATEMVENLSLNVSDASFIAGLIQQAITKLHTDVTAAGVGEKPGAEQQHHHAPTAQAGPPAAAAAPPGGAEAAVSGALEASATAGKPGVGGQLRGPGGSAGSSSTPFSSPPLQRLNGWPSETIADKPVASPEPGGREGAGAEAAGSAAMSPDGSVTVVPRVGGARAPTSAGSQSHPPPPGSTPTPARASGLTSQSSGVSAVSALTRGLQAAAATAASSPRPLRDLATVSVPLPLDSSLGPQAHDLQLPQQSLGMSGPSSGMLGSGGGGRNSSSGIKSVPSASRLQPALPPAPPPHVKSVHDAQDARVGADNLAHSVKDGQRVEQVEPGDDNRSDGHACAEEEEPACFF